MVKLPKSYWIANYRVCVNSESTILEDEKALRRMTNQIHNTEMLMNQMLDEHNKVQMFNSAMRDKLQEERERISQIEDALRVRKKPLRLLHATSSATATKVTCATILTKFGRHYIKALCSQYFNFRHRECLGVFLFA